MKKHVTWAGVIAVVALISLSGYAAADAPPDVTAQNLTVLHAATVAGPLLFAGGNYSSVNSHAGGPTGWSTILTGQKCTHVQLDSQYVDGAVLGHDRSDAMAFVTLRGMYPGVYVAGTLLILSNATDEVNRLKVCLATVAPGDVNFNYLVVNSGADG